MRYVSNGLKCISEPVIFYREDTTQTEMLIEEVENDNSAFVRRPRRLTRSRHVDIRHFLSSFGKFAQVQIGKNAQCTFEPRHVIFNNVAY